MTSVKTVIGKLRRHWLTFQMSLRYGRWSFRRSVRNVFAMSLLGLSILIFYYIVFAVELMPWNPTVDRWCDYEDVPQYMLRADPDEMTVVTMFLDLGVFRKGEDLFSYHSPYKYKRWMRTFGKMVNRVVAYMERDSDIEYFKQVRSCLPPSHTRIIKVHRNELSSFEHLEAIRHIYSRPSYPKYHPSTVYPEYSCAMNAKYDVLENACISDYFETPFFAWVDVGLFRSLDGTNYPLFKLIPPEKFNPERIGFSQAWPHDPVYSLQQTMKHITVWVSGSMVLAAKEYMLNFTRDYKEAVKELLDQGLSNTDQEVIYAMYSAQMRKPHYIKIKPYLCHQGQLGLHGADSRYFCLGYVCKNAWDKRVPRLQGAKN